MLLFSSVIAIACLSLVDAQIYIPGNAEWLGDYGDGDGTPDIFDYLPLSYTIFGDQGTVIPRVMVHLNESCPSLMVDASLELTQGELPQVRLRAAGDSLLPYAFPIRLCEVRLNDPIHKQAWSDGLVHFAGNNETVHIADDPRRFLLIGDTGLRVKPDDLSLGKCTDTDFLLYDIHQCPVNFTEASLNASLVDGDFQPLSDWPLKALQDFAAEQDPDVIVYVGDYLYRQGPCPNLGPNASGVDCVAINGPPKFTDADVNETSPINFLPANWGDTLFGWWADLFYPSLELFKSAPVIAIRGNHEICFRAGHGYHLFFAEQVYPDVRAGEWCEDILPPFAVPFPNEQFLVMDNGAVDALKGGIDKMKFEKGECPTLNDMDDLPYIPQQTSRYWDPSQTNANITRQLDIFTSIFDLLERKSQSHATNFLANHRPVFAVACNTTFMATLDWTMQQTLGPTTLDRVSAIISGHMHWLEVLAFENEDLPAQIVVGHGGTKLIPNYVDQALLPHIRLEVGVDNQYQGNVRKGITSSKMFGFAMMERNADDDYDITFYGLNQTLNRLEILDFDLTVAKGPRVTGEPSASMTPVPSEAPTESSATVSRHCIQMLAWMLPALGVLGL